MQAYCFLLQHAASVLRQLYQLHPKIANDPVYAAALRMLRINVGTDIDHHRMYVENGPEVDLICRRILDDDRGSGPVRPGRKRGASSSSDGLCRAACECGGHGKKMKRDVPPRIRVAVTS